MATTILIPNLGNLLFFVENKNLKSLRDEIDEIDEQVVLLLNKRLRAAAEIGMIKSAKGVEPYDPAREEVVFQKICKLSDGSMPDDSLRAIYREVISSSIALEKELIIGYLGPQATYTHQAAVRNFGSAVEYKPLLDIPEVFQSVETGECDYGVVPIENSSEGAVNRSLDLLVESDLTIIAQVYLEVQHCLFANCSMSDLREVRSKDHALAQCGEWLRRNLPKVKLTPTSSTAEAVRECKGEKYTGAIAGKLAGTIHQVSLLAQGIQDRKNNITRFLVVAKQASPKNEDMTYRTSLVLTLSDQVGALQNALKPFSSRGINLCKIESRPSGKKTWDYYFFVDFIGHQKQNLVSEALEEVASSCSYHRILGSYPEIKPNRN